MSSKKDSTKVLYNTETQGAVEIMLINGLSYNEIIAAFEILVQEEMVRLLKNDQLVLTLPPQKSEK